MIISRLIGGLGNQMFQYAVARRIALKHGIPMKLDLTGFETYTLHRYSLGKFAIQASPASREELARYLSPPGRAGKVLAKIGFGRRGPIVREKSFNFDPNVLESPETSYLEGYWQSEKYFADVADEIRKDFTVLDSPEGENARLAALIREGNSVSIHVRRGDYVSNAEHNRVHGTCDLHYYSRAVSLIAESVPSPEFYVFSDDPAWVKENLKTSFPMTYITHNDASRNYEDLRLISLCRHHVIANSTFSWWGAWLNRSPGKRVVAPRRWFASGEHDERDLVPSGWTRI